MSKDQKYWKENIDLILKCLSIWLISSYVFSIILVEQLNAIKIGGYKLGFWFAQQGSIYIFVILIFYYAFKMDQIDQRQRPSNK
jgi:putative solute:sodium symporter small subunit